MSTLDFTREQLAQYILNTAKESSLSKIRSIILNESKGNDIVAYTIKGEPVTRQQYIARNEQAVKEYENGEFMTTSQMLD